MNDTSFSPALIRILVIVAFLLLSQLMAFKRRTAPPRPTTPPTPPKDSPFELMRQAMLEAKQQARQGVQARRVRGEENAEVRTAPVIHEFPMQAPPPFSSGEQQFQIPPSIQPESSFFPTLLLIALVVCLAAMAYMYWAG